MRQKKSLFYLLILTLFLTFNLISCGGGGGGGAFGPTTELGFIKTVQATGDASGANIGGADSARYMMLYLAEDIQASGMISSIWMKRSAVMGAGINCPNVTVKMGHTYIGSLVTTFASNVEQGQGAFTTVINNASINVPAGAADTYFEIALPQSFNYNGVDNLVVEITRTAACTGAMPVAYHGGYDGVNMNTTSSTATTGTVLAAVVDARFIFTGGDDIAVGLSGSGSNYEPFLNIPNQKVQLLYTAGEINGSGRIAGIALPIGIATAAEGTYTINVRLGHTTLSALNPTFADNFNSGSPVTVASGATFSVPAGVPVDSYLWLPLPAATFNYNGTDNLIVEVEVTSASGQWVAWKLNNTSVTARRLPAPAGATTGTPDNSYYCIKFRFAGGNMDVFTAGNASLSFPFSDSALNNTQQFLYRAAELGTKGTIYGLSFRLVADSAAVDYGSFRVVVGTTTNTALNNTFPATFSGNMTGAQTLYNGTYSIPAGLKAGDWVYIPFSTPFVYDGVSNLVVQTANPGVGLVSNSIRAGNDATLYLDRRAFNNDHTSDTYSNADNILGDIRLWLVTGGASGK